MKGFLALVVVLLIAVAGFGLYRGWFRVGSDTVGDETNVSITIDKNKIKADEDKALDKLRSITNSGNEAKKDK